MPSVTPAMGKAAKLYSVDINEEVVTVMKKLKTDKSPGPDSILPSVLKECAEELSVPLTILF
jgi:hypothetical protein